MNIFISIKYYFMFCASFILNYTRAASRPIYHREALPIRPNIGWKGSFGAYSRFYGRVAMCDQIEGSGRSIGRADREMMNYVHLSRERYDQLRYTYQHYSDSEYRMHQKSTELLRLRRRRLNNSFNAFIHYKIKHLLNDQLTLSTKYSQAGINAALGDNADKNIPLHPNDQMFQSIHKRINRPSALLPVPKHIVTPRQRRNDRFDRRQYVR